MADLKLKVYSQDGKAVSTVSVSKDVFGIEPHNQSMFDAVMTYQANLRQATAKTKRDLKFPVVVKNHGDKKELVEQELVQHVHQSGLAVVPSLVQLVFKTSKLNKTKKNINLL